MSADARHVTGVNRASLSGRKKSGVHAHRGIGSSNPTCPSPHQKMTVEVSSSTRTRKPHLIDGNCLARERRANRNCSRRRGVQVRRGTSARDGVRREFVDLGVMPAAPRSR